MPHVARHGKDPMVIERFYSHHGGFTWASVNAPSPKLVHWHHGLGSLYTTMG